MLWPTFAEQLRRAVLEHPGEHEATMTELRTQVRKGHAMIVQAYIEDQIEAIGLIEFVDLRDGKMLHIRYLAGEGMAEWLDDLYQLLVTIGKEYGCSWLGLTGRCGWKKVLSDMGFKTVALQMRAEL